MSGQYAPPHENGTRVRDSRRAEEGDDSSVGDGHAGSALQACLRAGTKRAVVCKRLRLASFRHLGQMTAWEACSFNSQVESNL